MRSFNRGRLFFTLSHSAPHEHGAWGKSAKTTLVNKQTKYSCLSCFPKDLTSFGTLLPCAEHHRRILSRATCWWLSRYQGVRLSWCLCVRMSGCHTVMVSWCQVVRVSDCPGVRVSGCQGVMLTVWVSGFLWVRVSRQVSCCQVFILSGCHATKILKVLIPLCATRYLTPGLDSLIKLCFYS